MNMEIRLPDRALRYVLLQRTGYQVLPRQLWFRVLKKICPWRLDHFVVGLESRWRPKRIKRLYNEDFEREYRILAPALPAECARLLDIGCGVAGIDVLLHRHYADRNPAVILLDKTHVEQSIYYGFKNRGAFYNSLDVAREVLTSNGIPEDGIHLIQATDDQRIDTDGPIDLVISLISWGFHYPVETYLDRVHELLRPQGRLILDLRRGTNAQDALRAKFEDVRILQETDKYTRIVATK